MTKKWLEFLENVAIHGLGNVSENIFSTDDQSNLGLLKPRTHSETRFNKAVINFFVEYFYMQEKVSLKEFMDSLERAILIKMLRAFGGNQRSTAEFLGLNHTTLNQKIKKHNIRFRKIATTG